MFNKLIIRKVIQTNKKHNDTQHFYVTFDLGVALAECPSPDAVIINLKQNTKRKC